MLQHLVADNERVLAQIQEVLASVSERAYAGEDEPPSGIPIGAHVRHALEHYQALLGAREGSVDYDARPRDGRLERDRLAAMATTRSLAETLGRWRAEVDRPLGVSLRTGPRAQDVPAVAASSLARELHFVMLHAVHHLAMVAVELRLRGLPCDPDLGVAPATLGWQLSETA